MQERKLTVSLGAIAILTDHASRAMKAEAQNRKAVRALDALDDDLVRFLIDRKHQQVQRTAT